MDLARPARDGHAALERPATLELALLLALLVGLGLYARALDALLDPLFLDSDPLLWAADGGLFLVGMAGLLWVLAHLRGLRVGLARPDREASPLVGVTVCGTLVLVAIPFVPTAVATGLAPDHLLAALRVAPALFLDRTAVGVAVFALGMPLLYHGLVHGILSRVPARERAVAASALVGGYLVVPSVPGTVPVHDGVWFAVSPERLVGALLLVATLLAARAGARALDGRFRHVAWVLLVLAAALALLVLAAPSTGRPASWSHSPT